MDLKDVIIKPVITEKSTNLSKEFYIFEVNKKANKNQIKEAIEKIYKVKVDEIKSLIRKSKRRRVGRMMKIKYIPEKKIVFIKLKEGKIHIFPRS